MGGGCKYDFLCVAFTVVCALTTVKEIAARLSVHMCWRAEGWKTSVYSTYMRAGLRFHFLHCVGVTTSDESCQITNINHTCLFNKTVTKGAVVPQHPPPPPPSTNGRMTDVNRRRFISFWSPILAPCYAPRVHFYLRYTGATTRVTSCVRDRRRVVAAAAPPFGAQASAPAQSRRWPQCVQVHDSPMRDRSQWRWGAAEWVSSVNSVSKMASEAAQRWDLACQ